jgi:hypothetical protein
MSKAKDMKKVFEALEAQGFYVDKTGKHASVDNNALFKAGDANALAHGRHRMNVAKTPREDKGVNNAIARLRRVFGFKWQGH